MPLRDHFRAPVNNTHSWDEVHGQWPGEMVRDLRNILPAGFRAAPNVHLGSAFEVGVFTDESVAAPDIDEGGTATQTALSPTLTVEADLSEQDEYEVRIYDAEHGRVLVAAIEIVSPSNKDRPATRVVFVGKVATLLQQGICVSIVDLVSVRLANLYAELLALLGHADPSLGEPLPHLYAVTLRAQAPEAADVAPGRLVLSDDRRPAAADDPDLARPGAAGPAAAGNQLRGDVPDPRHRVRSRLARRGRRKMPGLPPRIHSTQDFNRQAGEGTEAGVGRQEKARTLFDGRGKLERVQRLEVLGRADAGGPVADRGGDGHDPHVRAGEEGVILRLDDGVPGADGQDQALHPHQVTDHERVARGLGGGDPGLRDHPPVGVRLQGVDDDVRIQEDDHSSPRGRSSGCRWDSAWIRSIACTRSSSSRMPAR